MAAGPQWSYAQARLQARYGARLDEAGWRAIESAKSADRFLENARGTFLARYGARLDAAMTSHAMESLLRAEWRDSVSEVARWVPAAWRDAVIWLQALAELPLQMTEDGTEAVARWSEHWRALWPRDTTSHRRMLERFCATIARHVTALRQADSRDGSGLYRRQLQKDLTLLFRHGAEGPAALFSYLALLLLDLERFRGGLVRRRLFQDSMRSAA